MLLVRDYLMHPTGAAAANGESRAEKAMEQVSASVVACDMHQHHWACKNGFRDRCLRSQEDFPVVGWEAAWLLAEFGYRFGVRRPHQRLLHLEAVGNVARDEGSALGPRHAPVLYQLLCAAQAESFLTKTEASKHVQIVSGLSGLS